MKVRHHTHMHCELVTRSAHTGSNAVRDAAIAARARRRLAARRRAAAPQRRRLPVLVRCVSRVCVGARRACVLLFLFGAAPPSLQLLCVPALQRAKRPPGARARRPAADDAHLHDALKLTHTRSHQCRRCAPRDPCQRRRPSPQMKGSCWVEVTPDTPGTPLGVPFPRLRF